MTTERLVGGNERDTSLGDSIKGDESITSQLWQKLDSAGEELEILLNKVEGNEGEGAGDERIAAAVDKVNLAVASLVEAGVIKSDDAWIFSRGDNPFIQTEAQKEI